MKRALRVLISAGPTREPIDPVRFISNYSTGYMGTQLAAASLRRGHRVTVVSGPGSEALPRAARVVPVEQAGEMAAALRSESRRADIVIMAAAVSDFQPVRRAESKQPRRARWTLRLRATPDIVGQLPRRPGQVVAGFALETGSEQAAVQRASRKLRAKRLDVILAQQALPGRTPFGRRSIRAWLLERNGSVTALGWQSKTVVAGALLDKIEALWYGQPEPTKGRHGTAKT